MGGEEGDEEGDGDGDVKKGEDESRKGDKGGDGDRRAQQEARDANEQTRDDSDDGVTKGNGD